MRELEEGIIIEGYTIIQTLGEGGMAKVYLAKDHKNNLYAIKEMGDFSSDKQKEISASSFRKEMEILKNISHRGLPRFYRSFYYYDRVYIVMEYIEGETLEEKLNSSAASLQEKDILTWAIQLCEIFFYLHTLSPSPVIYRDIKPSNIIITKKNRASLIDFGIARRYDPVKHSDTFRLGTPGYAAPEQFSEYSQSNPRTDIYALGVLLHQLITKYDPTKTPFKLPSIRSLRPDISLNLEEIIEKAINLKQEERYGHMYEFRKKLIDYYKEKFGFFNCSYIDERDSSEESKQECVTRDSIKKKGEEDSLLIAEVDTDRDIKKIAPPPRNITALMYIHIIPGFPASLFFIGLGILWLTGFIFSCDRLHEIQDFKGDVETVEGTVTSSVDKHESHGIFKHEVHYTFNSKKSNRSFAWVSYRRDKNSKSYNKGDKVVVEYLKDDALTSRIKGMKVNEESDKSMFIFFNMIAFLFALLCIPVIINRIYLIKYGKSATGILKEKIPGKNVKLSFILITDEGTIHKDIIISSYRSDEDYKIKDKVHVLYDHFNINRVAILDELPLKLNDSGDFCPYNSPGSYFSLLSPLFPLAILFLYIYCVYF